MPKAYYGLRRKSLKGNFLSLVTLAALLTISACTSAQSITDVEGPWRFKDQLYLPAHQNANSLDSTFTVDPATGRLKFVLRGVSLVAQPGVDSIRITNNGGTIISYSAGVATTWNLTTFHAYSSLNYNSTRIINYNINMDPLPDSVNLPHTYLNVGPGLTKEIVGDTVTISSAGGGSGSGISKVGSPAYGLTRTDDSTYIADTAVLTSQTRTTAGLAQKVFISDTAAMLLPYRNKINQNTDSLIAHNLRIGANTAAIALKEPALGNPSVDGYILSKTIAGVPSWIAPAAGGTTPTNFHYDSTGVNYLGIVYNKNNWSGLTDFTNNGGTFNVTSNKIVGSAGSGTFTQTLDVNGYTALERWKVAAKVKVTAATSGFGVGLRSANSNGFLYQVIGKFNSTSGAVEIYAGTSTLVKTSSSVLTFSTNDYIVLTTERIQDSIIVTARNQTTNSTTVSATYKYTLGTSATIFLPNTGKFSVYSFGGSFTVDSLDVSSREIKNSKLAAVGDSKTAGYYASTQPNRYADKLATDFVNCVVHAGASDGTPDVINRLTELISLHPSQVLMAIGSNDIRYGLSSATTYANYDTITARLERAGIVVYHLLPFYESGLDQTGLKAHIESTFSSSKIIDTYSATLQPNMTNAAHPTDLGMDIIYNTIVQSFKLVGSTHYIDKTLSDYDVVLNSNRNISLNNYTLKFSSDFLVGLVTIGNGRNFIAGNLALGEQSLYALTLSGTGNTGAGNFTLQKNTTGAENFAGGLFAFQNNLGGTGGTATGWSAGQNNTSGSYNVFNGRVAGGSNTTGGNNTYSGAFSGYSNNGSSNVASGYAAMYTSSAANYCVSIGEYSSRQQNKNFATALGYNANYNGSWLNSTALGALSQNTADSQIVYGNAIVKNVFTGYHIIKPSYFTPTTGTTVTTTTGINIINPAGTLAALTIALPVSPADGQIVEFSFSQIITALTFSGGTLANSITTASAGVPIKLTYSTSASLWFTF